MKLVHHSDTNTTLEGAHRFVINLRLLDTGRDDVRSCEVLGSHFRNRFTFPSKVSLDDVFIGEVAAGIKQCLNSLSGGAEVVSLPSVAIELPGLTLARAHIIASEAEDGRGVILRFKLLLGSINRVFRKDLGIEDHVHDHTANMSAMVLTDIVLPLLDLCTTAENGAVSAQEGFETFMDTLIDRSQEVRFQSELIKRFVSNVNARPVQARREQLPERRIELVSRR